MSKQAVSKYLHVLEGRRPRGRVAEGRTRNLRGQMVDANGRAAWLIEHTDPVSTHPWSKPYTAF